MADPKDFLTDDEMAQHEASQSSGADFISDEAMDALDSNTTNTNQILPAGSVGGAIERGLKHGVTAGFEDRLGALAGAVGTEAGKSESPGLQTAVDVGALGSAAMNPIAAAIDPSIRNRLKALYGAYEQALPETRQDISQADKQVEASHPKTKMAAQFVGGALPFMLTGGGSAAAEGALAPVAEMSIPGAIKVGAQKGLQEIPTMAGLGAAQGAAATEDLTNLPDAAKNVAIGAGVGALTAPVGGALLGGVGAAIPAAGRLAGEGLETAKGILPTYIKNPIESFIVNTREGVNTLTAKGREAIRQKGIEAAQGTAKEVIGHQTGILENAAQELKGLAEQIHSTVSAGSEQEKQSIAKVQLARAQELLNSIVEQGQAAGADIGDLMKGTEGTTNALANGLHAFEAAVNESPYLRGSSEAQEVLANFKQKLAMPEKKIGFTAVTREVPGESVEGELAGSLQTFKDKLATGAEIKPADLEQLSALPRDQLESSLKEIFPNLERKAATVETVKNPENDILSTTTKTQYEGSVPGGVRPQADTAEFQGFIGDLDSAIQKYGKDTAVGRQLTILRKNVASSGRSDLLGAEGKAAYDTASGVYGAYKDLLAQYGIEDKSELSNRIVTELGNISKDTDSVSKLNRFDILKKRLTNVSPELAGKLESTFMQLNEQMGQVPEAKSAKSVASFLQGSLPGSEQSAAQSIEKGEIFDPLARYAGKDQAQAIESKATMAAQKGAMAEEAIAKANPDKIIQNLQNQKYKSLSTQKYMQDLAEMVDKIEPGRKEQFMTQNKKLIQELGAAAAREDESSIMAHAVALANLLSGAAGKVAGMAARGAKLPFNAYNNAVKSVGTVATKSSFLQSKLPGLYSTAQELETKGLSGAAKIVKDMASSEPAERAAASFNASQIPALRRAYEEQKRKDE